VNTTNGLSVNDSVIITGVQGNTAANGTWVVSAISGGKGGAKITLKGSTGNGTYTGGGTWTRVNTGTTTNQNVFVLMGRGHGRSRSAGPYRPGGAGGPAPAPSFLAVTPSPLVRVTTFASGGTVVSANLINNGDFEARDLSGEQGNLLGWLDFNFNTSPG